MQIVYVHAFFRRPEIKNSGSNSCEALLQILKQISCNGLNQVSYRFYWWLIELHYWFKVAFAFQILGIFSMQDAKYNFTQVEV